VENTPSAGVDETNGAPAPTVFIIDDDDKSPTPKKSATRSPSPSTVGNIAGGMDFLSMAEPSQEAIAKSHVQVLRANLQHLEERLEEQKQKMQAHTKQHEEQLGAEHIRRDNAIKAERRKHDEKINDMQQGFVAGIEASNRRLDDAREQHQADLQALEEEHSAAMQNLKQAHATELEDLVDQLNAKIAEHEEQTLAIETALQGDIAELKDEANDYKQHCEVIEAELRWTHAAELEQAQLDHLSEIEAMTQMTMEEFEVRLDEVRNACHAEHKEQFQRHGAAIDSMRLAHKAELDQAKQGHEADALAELQTLKNMVSERDGLMDDLEKKLDQVTQSASKLRSERDQLRTSLRSHAEVPLPSPIIPIYPSPAAPPSTRHTTKAGSSQRRHDSRGPYTHEEHIQSHTYGRQRTDCGWCTSDMASFSRYA